MDPTRIFSITTSIMHSLKLFSPQIMLPWAALLRKIINGIWRCKVALWPATAGLLFQLTLGRHFSLQKKNEKRKNTTCRDRCAQSLVRHSCSRSNVGEPVRLLWYGFRTRSGGGVIINTTQKPSRRQVEPSGYMLTEIHILTCTYRRDIDTVNSSHAKITGVETEEGCKFFHNIYILSEEERKVWKRRLERRKQYFRAH